MIISPMDNRCQLELLPEHAGICHRLVFTSADGQLNDVLATCSEQELAEGNPWYRGTWLYPFASRISKGQYSWQGQYYRFPINEPARDNALHGLLTRVTPEVLSQDIQQESAEVTLAYHYDGFESAYPFPGEVTVTYLLQSPGQLTMTLSVTNLHDAPVPVGVGWHPYFSLEEKVDDLYLQLPKGDRVNVDDRLLPTGSLSGFPDFETLAPIGELTIDASLALQKTESRRVQSLLWSPRRKVGVVVWQEVTKQEGETKSGQGCYPYLQVFIPPDRQSIALEPVSCGINAFNTRENLLTLVPGERRDFVNGVSLVNSPDEFSLSV